MNELDLLHNDKEKRKVWSSFLKCLHRLPVHEIRNYYGEQVAFFYSWFNFYILWLIPAAIIGITLTAVRPEGVTVDNAPYVPFFALWMVIWGFFFVKIWRRKTHEYAYMWNTSETVKKQTYRPSFYGVWKKSEITGELELYYPSGVRKMKYLVSILVTVFMLGVAFVVMICSLNLQGYVSCTTRYGTPNPFHVEKLHQFSEPGALFDPNGNAILALVPVVIHAVVIMILNQLIYSRIATALTDWENHKTDEDYENSLILKRFLFEAFDCYISLFYLAFFELDIMRLRSELMALFTSDCIRRVLTETLLPLIIRKAKKRSSKNGEKVEKPELELFDDYLEMVIQYGYVTLFASAFPFAAAVALVSNILESKSDAFKLSFLCKRPLVHRVKSIGTWETVITVQTWIAVLTNVFLFGFSSEQMLQWFPWLFDHVEVVVDGVTYIEQELREGSGRYVMAFVFTLEHLLLLLGLVIMFVFNDIPKWVRIAKEKREYVRAREVKELRQEAKQASKGNLNLDKKNK